MLENWKQSYSLYELGVISSVALISGYILGNTLKTKTKVKFMLTWFKSHSVWINFDILNCQPCSQKRAESAENSEDEEEESTLSGSIDASQFNNFKLVLVVRTDLGMTKGKIAAQCGHATLACYKSTMRTNPGLIRRWEHTGQAKVALRCDSEEQM